jgi:hypothetical protein
MITVRRIMRVWETKNGETKIREYYYWYNTRNVNGKSISDCVGVATEEDYRRFKEQ